MNQQNEEKAIPVPTNDHLVTPPEGGVREGDLVYFRALDGNMFCRVLKVLEDGKLLVINLNSKSEEASFIRHEESVTIYSRPIDVASLTDVELEKQIQAVRGLGLSVGKKAKKTKLSKETTEALEIQSGKLTLDELAKANEILADPDKLAAFLTKLDGDTKEEVDSDD